MLSCYTTLIINFRVLSVSIRPPFAEAAQDIAISAEVLRIEVWFSIASHSYQPLMDLTQQD